MSLSSTLYFSHHVPQDLHPSNCLGCSVTARLSVDDSIRVFSGSTRSLAATPCAGRCLTLQGFLEWFKCVALYMQSSRLLSPSVALLEGQRKSRARGRLPGSCRRVPSTLRCSEPCHNQPRSCQLSAPRRERSSTNQYAGDIESTPKGESEILPSRFRRRLGQSGEERLGHLPGRPVTSGSLPAPRARQGTGATARELLISLLLPSQLQHSVTGRQRIAIHPLAPSQRSLCCAQLLLPVLRDQAPPHRARRYIAAAVCIHHRAARIRSTLSVVLPA
jgi:hypothetical protein